jgi:hypothetical protein
MIMSDITSEDVQTWIMTKADAGDLKLLQDIIKMKMQLQFKVGDKVWFDAKTRGIIRGTITKMNAKTAKVRTDAGVMWTVAPQLLQKETLVVSP